MPLFYLWSSWSPVDCFLCTFHSCSLQLVARLLPSSLHVLPFAPVSFSETLLPPPALCMSLTFHPIISAVTPPPNISPTLSPPSLDYPLCFFATLLEFNAIVHQFCPGSLALTFIVPQSPLMLFFFPLFLFFSLCMKFRYITFSHHQFTKKAVC